MHLSRQFNNFINDNRLLELKLTTRKYTWSNGTKFALLDRILVSITWDHLYPSSHLSDLSSTGSDHCPLLVQTNTTIPISKPIFRFDPLWIEKEDFGPLVTKWWNETPLQLPDIGKSWSQKLKKMRSKMKGWAKKFYGQRKKEKNPNTKNLV